MYINIYNFSIVVEIVDKLVEAISIIKYIYNRGK